MKVLRVWNDTRPVINERINYSFKMLSHLQNLVCQKSVFIINNKKCFLSSNMFRIKFFEKFVLNFQ